MPRLAGKVPIITGAGTGIGRATAVLFAREGAKVAVAEIDAAAGEETAHLAGRDTIFIRTDVTDEASVQAAVRTTVQRFGALHVLHNNAGGSTPQDNTVVEAPIEEFWRVIKLDLFGRSFAAAAASRRSSRRAAARSSTCRRTSHSWASRDATATPRRRVAWRRSRAPWQSSSRRSACG